MGSSAVDKKTVIKRDALQRVRLERRFALLIALVLLGLGSLFLAIRTHYAPGSKAVQTQESAP
jgi:hypothetical protein